MSCRILGHINNDNVFVLHKRHNHDDEKGKILRKKLLKTVIEESVESGRPAMEVITRNTANMDDTVIKELFTHKYRLVTFRPKFFLNFTPMEKFSDDNIVKILTKRRKQKELYQ